MKPKFETRFYLFSVIFLSITIGFFSYSLNTSFAQAGVGVGVGIESETEIKVGDESDEDESEVSVETTTEAAAKAGTSSGSEKESSEQKSESSTKMSSTTQININTFYPKIKASSDNSFAVQSHQKLYQPGDKIRVEGSIWSNLMAQLGGTDSITIQVFDSKGTLVKESTTEIKSDGKFAADIMLPTSSVEGKYSIKSKINSDSSILGTLSAETKAKLETTTNVVVSTPSTVKIQVEGHGDFDVKIASSSKVSKVEFKETEKKVSFTVEGETGTKGVTQVSIPKALLSGQMTVLIDGKVVASDDVIVTTNTEATTTLELNYNHSIHNIDVVGTNAVPEFGALASIILVAAVGGIITLSTKYKNLGIKI